MQTEQKPVIDLTVFEAENSRYLYISGSGNNSMTSFFKLASMAILRQQISFVKKSKTGVGLDLWLACPNRKKKAPATTGVIDHFSDKKRRWTGTSHRQHKLYR